MIQNALLHAGHFFLGSFQLIMGSSQFSWVVITLR